MDLDSLIRFFGWAAFTFVWLNVNITFVEAIAHEILDHNRAMRLQGACEGYKQCQKEMQKIKESDTGEES